MNVFTKLVCVAGLGLLPLGLWGQGFFGVYEDFCTAQGYGNCSPTQVGLRAKVLDTLNRYVELPIFLGVDEYSTGNPLLALQQVHTEDGTVLLAAARYQRNTAGRIDYQKLRFYRAEGDSYTERTADVFPFPVTQAELMRFLRKTTGRSPGPEAFTEYLFLDRGRTIVALVHARPLMFGSRTAPVIARYRFDPVKLIYERQ